MGVLILFNRTMKWAAENCLRYGFRLTPSFISGLGMTIVFALSSASPIFGQSANHRNPLRPNAADRSQIQRSVFNLRQPDTFILLLRPGSLSDDVFTDQQLADLAINGVVPNSQSTRPSSHRSEATIIYDAAVHQVNYEDSAVHGTDPREGFSAFSNVEVADFEASTMPDAPATQNLAQSNPPITSGANPAVPAEALSRSSAPGQPSGSPSAPSPGAVTATPPPPTTFGPALPAGFSLDQPVSQQLIGELFDEIQRQKDLLSSSPENEDEQRVRQTKVLDESYSSLIQAKNLQKKDFLQREGIRMFEADKQILEEKLEVEYKPQMPAEDQSAGDLFARLEQFRLEMDDLNSQLRGLNEKELQHKVRLKEIPKQRLIARKRIGEIKKQLKNEELGDADTIAMIRLRAEELELEYRIESLDSESKLDELQNRLLPLESDFLARRVKTLEAEIEAWNTAANLRRRMDLEAEARQARAQVIDAAPALRELATLNAELAERRIKFTELIRTATDEEIEVKNLLNSVRSQHGEVEKSIVDNTLSQANGLLLVDIRRKMVRPFKSRQRIRSINRELQKISLDRLKINEQREPLSHPNEYAAAMLQGVHSETISNQELFNMAVEIVESIRQQYDQLSAGHHTYIDLLGKIVAEREELVAEIDATMKFVNQKSLWVRSAQPIGIEQVAKSRYGVAHFFSPHQWTQLLGDLTHRFVTSPHESAAGLIGLVALFTISRRFKV